LGLQPFYGLETFPLSEKLTAQVNLSTGNLVVHSKDVALNAPGLSVNLDRFYNSLSTGQGSVGAKTVLGTGRDVGLQFPTAGTATFYGPSGFTATFTRNADGNTFTAPPGVNADLIQGGTQPNGLQLTYRKTGEKLEFNYFGYMMADLDRNGTGLTFAYNGDPSYSLASVADAAGRVTTFNNPGGVTSTVTDPAGRVTTYTHDGAGNLTQSTSGAGAVTTYTYDATNNLTAVQAPGGNWTAFGYDGAGRVTSVSRYTTTGQNGGDAAVTGFGYTPNPDGSGQATETNPLGKNTMFALDTLGRVTAVTDPLGHTRAQTYTANSDVQKAVDAMGTANTPANETTYTYDTNNNLTAVKAPTGASATAAYTNNPSTNGSPTCTSNNSGSLYQAHCTSDPQQNQQRYSYDGNGNLFYAEDWTGGGAGGGPTYFREMPGWFASHCGGKIGQLCTLRNANGVDTNYSYNANGDLARVVPPGPLTPVTYGYDSLSRVTSVTDGKGQTTTYTYDAADHVLSVQYAGGAQLTSTYDRDGQALTQTDTTGANSAYTYDTLGRQTSSTVPGAASNVITTGYDKAGNVTAYTDKAGTVGYTYDGANELVGLAEPGGDCTSTPGTKCTRFAYNNNGALNSTIYPGGVTQQTTVDPSGRPTRITATGPGAGGPGTGAVLSDLGYTYTAAGGSGPSADRSVVQSRSTGVDAGGVTPNGASTSYAYDSYGRVTNVSETLPGGAVNAAWGYAYDRAGNRTARRVVVPGGQAFDTGYGNNAANQLTSRTGDVGSWTYDANGNQTNAPGAATIPGASGTPTNTNTLNPRDQITQTTSTTTPVPFSYAGAGNNNRLTAGATAYQTGVLGQSSQTTGSTTQAFTRTPGGALISMRTGTTSLYYLTDNQGSVIGLVNDQGQKVAGYAYNPYGETRTITGTPTGDLTQANTNPYRYTSGYLDTTSNLYKLGYRYYDPTQGRFTQQDPSGQEPNHYLYAGGDPINGTDPTGLYCIFGTHGGPGGSCRGAGVTDSSGFKATVGAVTGALGGCARGTEYGALVIGLDETGVSEVAGCVVGGSIGGFSGGAGGGVGVDDTSFGNLFS